MKVDEAIRAVRDQCPNAYARAYAREAGAAAADGGTAALRAQINYMLANMRNWKGGFAREVKEALRRYVREHA